MDEPPLVVCLSGPTASGKTDVAVELVRRLPLEIVSVDSAMVYRGLDIGTAKPGPEVLDVAPHRLIDLVEPNEPYSAGRFVRDALAAIDEIRAAGRTPLLAGGTFLYFRALERGLARLPAADPALRRYLDAEAERHGWPAMHARLAAVDPAAAARIEPGDSQRLQRALEVWYLTGQPISVLQAETAPPRTLRFLKLGLRPRDRVALGERIRVRLGHMVRQGLVEEVAGLRARGDLDADTPSMRSVGYRQLWQHLEGRSTLEEALDAAAIATRRLAKRQLTWMRADAGIRCHDPLERDVTGPIFEAVARALEAVR